MWSSICDLFDNDLRDIRDVYADEEETIEKE